MVSRFYRRNDEDFREGRCYVAVLTAESGIFGEMIYSDTFKTREEANRWLDLKLKRYEGAEVNYDIIEVKTTINIKTLSLDSEME